VSLAYPLVSLGFVLTMLFGVQWLGEPFSWQRLAGCGLIVAGVFLLAADA
jgi:multidrug transporter EmrE-like cation transporter